jgi:hypothetical protein
MGVGVGRGEVAAVAVAVANVTLRGVASDVALCSAPFPMDGRSSVCSPTVGAGETGDNTETGAVGEAVGAGEAIDVRVAVGAG